MLILAVATIYFLGFHANEVLFSYLQHHRGAHWIFLPAGLRLLSILLLGAKGAVGIFLGSLLVTWQLGESSLMGHFIEPLISAGAPMITYYIALRSGLSFNLKNLSAKLLLVLSLAFATTNALLHSLWYASEGIAESFSSSFIVMFVGDLLGTIIVIYIIRLFLVCVPDRKGKYDA
jgi:hypothetical protein